jgi:hypothetical protein
VTQEAAEEDLVKLKVLHLLDVRTCYIHINSSLVTTVIETLIYRI